MSADEGEPVDTQPAYTEADCDPDCAERSDCSTPGVGHLLCGRCAECGQPRHHHCQHLRLESAGK